MIKNQPFTPNQLNYLEIYNEFIIYIVANISLAQSVSITITEVPWNEVCKVKEAYAKLHIFLCATVIIINQYVAIKEVVVKAVH